MNSIDPQRQDHVRSERFTRFVAITTALVGFLTLVGWAGEIAPLKNVLPGLVTMAPNTALCFVLCGAALWLSQPEGRNQRRWGSIVCAGLVVSVGLATLGEYLFDRDLGIDRVLFRAAVETERTPTPGRMSLATAVSFVLMGGALALLDVKLPRLPAPAQVLATVAAMVATTALVCYAYGVPALYALKPYSTMALHTAATFLLLAHGVLLARPRQGLMQVVTGETLGGVVVRRQIPIAIAVVFLLGWLRLKGQEYGLYEPAFGASLAVVTNLAIFVLMIVWTGRDIHRLELERRHTEQRVELAVDGAKVGTWDYNPQSGELIWSDRCRQMFGLTPDAHIDYETFIRCVHPDDRERTNRTIQESFDPRGTGEQDFEYRTLGPDGALRWVAAKGRALFAGTGPQRHVVRVIGAVIDITQQRVAEEQAARYLAELTHLGRIKVASEIAAGLAHELNQPLTSISVQAGLASSLARSSDTPIAPPLTEALDEIAVQAQRAGQVIHVLRDFVRKGETERATVQLNEIVGDVVRLVEAQLRQLGIRLALDLQPTAEIVVDRVQIGQVLLNLFQNGIDALENVEASRRLIEISTRNDGDAVVLTVHDTGKGIPTEMLDRVFESFFTTKSQGIGLGLAISRTIVEAHHGRLWADSKPGQGATFSLRLPRGGRDEG